MSDRKLLDPPSYIENWSFSVDLETEKQLSHLQWAARSKPENSKLSGSKVQTGTTYEIFISVYTFVIQILLSI